MAKLIGGFLGGFSGKLGSVVGYQYNGVDVLRSLPVKREYIPTAMQLEQREKFRVVRNFTTLMSPILSQTFPKSKISRSNRPFANVYAAVTGNYPDFEIDFSKVLLAYGPLEKADVVIEAVGKNLLRFKWKTDRVNERSAGDEALLICYCPETLEVAYTFGPATRQEGAASLILREFSGKTVHAWMTFTKGSKAGVSVYCGCVTIGRSIRKTGTRRKKILSITD